MKFGLDSSILVSGSFDKTVKIWDMRSRSYLPVQTISEAKDGITSIETTEKEIIYSSSDGSIYTHDVSNGKTIVDSVGSLDYNLFNIFPLNKTCF